MAANREILWNVNGLPEVVLMYALFALSLVVLAIGLQRRVALYLSGRDAPEYTGLWFKRLLDLYVLVVLQQKVVSDRTPGIFHTLIYLGFLSLLFATTMVFIHHDLGIEIYQGDFYLAVTLVSDVLGFGVLIGCAMAAHRRYLAREDRVHNRFADSFMLWLLALLIVQGFTLEGLRIHATNDPWAAYSPIGNLFAQFFWPLSINASSILHYVMWWWHAISVFLFIAIIPYTKFFHVLASAANLYFLESGRPRGALPSPGVIEDLMQSGEDFKIGLENIKDYTWKQLLELDACTSCGRCQAACPAYLSGKPLSPKWLILDTRNHMLALQGKNELAPSHLPDAATRFDQTLLGSFYLGSSGVQKSADGKSYQAQGEFRAQNPLVQKSVRTLGASPEARISGDVMDPDVFWSCTTCRACVEACPVGINHIDQIIGVRRNMVLMQGEIPSEAQSTLRALETRGNPFGAPADRMKWAEGLSVPVLKPGASVDYLYWVGCVSAYDQRKQKIARSLVQCMNAAGLSYGVLGIEESCSGDPARRLGEENLFQTLAKRNIELLRSIQFRYVVANCPHCFNTIKNEYPQFGNLSDGKRPEIIHHSRLLKQLLAEGKLRVSDSSEDYTFHDPCYLGRYNGEYQAPRETLTSVKGLRILEMERSADKGLCCGAGGGHFWMDMKIGERVNVLRVNEAAASGASKVATACPFCMQMLEDGAKLTNREESLRIKDIAEVIAEKLVSGADNHAPPDH